MPDRTKYNLDYRPASYWTTPGDGGGEGHSVRRRAAFDLGREFLPDKQPNEVEIALISLASVTGDLIAITAWRRGGRIVYRIVDEYGTAFRCKPATSTQPLSLGELIALIDGATGHLGGHAKGLTGAYRADNAAFCDPESLVDFVIVTSDFYPELEAYYAEEAREWLASLEG
jgi:hypothetical protein